MRPAVPFALALPLALAACLASPEHPERAAATPRFDPARFFSGASRGEGRLRVVLRGAVPVRVRSDGRLAPDGTLVLDQVIAEGAKPPRTRRWVLREVAPGRWSGTLTDATGPVTGIVTGNRLTLAFRIGGGFAVRQWLYLQPGGRVARNGLDVSRWGVRIARLDETITRAGD